MSVLSESFELPNGHVVPNRIVKSAMSEVLAERGGAPGEALFKLYERWARGGTGVLVTGNVVFDRRGRTEPDNVVADREHLEAFREWADRTHAAGAQLWMQINHSGRQASRQVTNRPLAPSSVSMRTFGPLFAQPQELSEEQIEELIQGWAATALLAKDAGFDGVQVHAAHGYLVSQFLSPLANQRTDQWGGTPQNRRRFLIEIVRAIRGAVGAKFPVGVKLNSADFQRGGFNETESMAVVAALEAEGIELLEISGGNYESPQMTGLTDSQGKLRDSSRAREAYFLDYAASVRKQSSLPLLLTGGLRSTEMLEKVITDGHVDLVGLARPLCVDPDFPRLAMAGESERANETIPRIGAKLADSMLQIVWYQRQIHRMAAGQEPDPKLDVWSSVALGFWQQTPFHRSKNGRVRAQDVA